MLSVCRVSLLPPGVEKRQIEIGAAAAHVLVDADRSFILSGASRNTDFSSLNSRAELFGNLIASPPVRALIARRMGVEAGEIATIARLTAEAPDAMSDAPSEQRADQIALSRRPYRLDLQTDPVRPVLSIYAQAPSTPAAIGLAEAAMAGLREHLTRRADMVGSPHIFVRLDQLGPARGGVINHHMAPQIALLTFLVVFAACVGLLSIAVRVHRGRRAASRADRPPGRTGQAHTLIHRGGDWPRTTRVLPWMVAAFLAMLWLLPFNTIELTASLPFDLKLDRIVLPFVLGLWALALAVGGAGAPRIRATWIHVGIGAFGAVVGISIILNALSLNQALEFDLAVKKLALVLAYGLFFLVVSSVVRRSEIHAFLRYTLGLAVLAAAGMLWEHRVGYNIFYDLSDWVLPPIFEVGQAEAGFEDAKGRALTRGPGEHPLEAVAMLSMALPIAVVGMLRSARWRTTLLYGLAACVMVAALLSTDRKSALLAPLAVLLVIAYYRRADLLRLAPVAAAGTLAVQLLSPGSLSSVLFQLRPDQLGVDTVSDRAADYDAVRPDVWTNLLFGRGYGTYDPSSYRVLDSEVLNRLVDTGVIGLLFLLAMLLSIALTASGPIRSGDPVNSAVALAIAPAAAAFLVLAFLFDVGGYPHPPYILMSLAALLAVLVSSPEVCRSRSDERRRPMPLREVVAPPPARGARRAPAEGQMVPAR